MYLYIGISVDRGKATELFPYEKAKRLNGNSSTFVLLTKVYSCFTILELAFL